MKYILSVIVLCIGLNNLNAQWCELYPPNHSPIKVAPGEVAYQELTFEVIQPKSFTLKELDFGSDISYVNVGVIVNGNYQWFNSSNSITLNPGNYKMAVVTGIRSDITCPYDGRVKISLGTTDSQYITACQVNFSYWADPQTCGWVDNRVNTDIATPSGGPTSYDRPVNKMYYSNNRWYYMADYGSILVGKIYYTGTGSNSWDKGWLDASMPGLEDFYIGANDFWGLTDEPSGNIYRTYWNGQQWTTIKAHPTAHSRDSRHTTVIPKGNQLFFISDDNRIHVLQGNNFQDEIIFNNSLIPLARNNSPIAELNGDIYYIGQDDHIYYLTWYAPWGSWAAFRANNYAAKAGAQTEIIARDGYVFYCDVNRRIRVISGTAASNQGLLNAAAPFVNFSGHFTYADGKIVYYSDSDAIWMLVKNGSNWNYSKLHPCIEMSSRFSSAVIDFRPGTPISYINNKDHSLHYFSWVNCKKSPSFENDIESLSQPSNQLEIYPNPAQTRVTVSGVETGDEVVLMNAMGQVVRTISAQTEQLNIERNDLASGVYFLKISGSKGNRFIRFVFH